MTAEAKLKRIKNLKTFEKDEEHFSGEYKEKGNYWSIEITKEEELTDHWYIIVTGDLGTNYDGYWESYTATIDDAIIQALQGSGFIKTSK